MKRKIQFDLLRILACIGVVAIHVSDELLLLENHFGGLSWWYGVFLNSAFRFAVPFFVMLSGYFHLAGNVRTQAEMNKKALRVFLIGWIAHAAYSFWYSWWRVEPLSDFLDSSQLLSGKIGHLYFMLIIAGLYIVTPALQSYIRKSTTRTQVSLLLLSFSFSSMAVTSEYLFGYPTLQMSISYFLFYLGYYLVGYFLSKTTIQKWFVGICTLLFIFFVGLTVFLTGQTIIAGSSIWQLDSGAIYWTDYRSPLVIGMSVTLFLVLSWILSRYKFVYVRYSQVILPLSAATLGVYVIHVWVLDYLSWLLDWAVHLVTSQIWLYVSQKIVGIVVVSFVIMIFWNKMLAIVLDSLPTFSKKSK